MNKKSAKQFCKENLGKEVTFPKYDLFSTDEDLDRVKGMIVGYVKDSDDMIVLSFENSVEGWIREAVDESIESIKFLIQSPLCKSYWVKNVDTDFKFV